MVRNSQASLAKAHQYYAQMEAAIAEYTAQANLLATSINDTRSGFVTWWRADQVDAEGRVARAMLGNGLMSYRDYDPASGQLRTVRTGVMLNHNVQPLLRIRRSEQRPLPFR